MTSGYIYERLETNGIDKRTYKGERFAEEKVRVERKYSVRVLKGYEK